MRLAHLRATLAFAAVLAIAWPFLPDFTLSVIGSIGLAALVAVGLALLTGIGGMTSFGQAAFVGIGAYTTAWVSKAGLDAGVASAALPWLGLALGLVSTFALAWWLGAITIRLSGHYLPLCTIAWGLSLYYLFGNLDFIGGHTGIGGVVPIDIAGVDLASPRALGPLIWLVLLVAIVLLHNLLDSRSGRAIRALKGGLVLAESIGIDTARHRIKVFVLAAVLASLSGWLYAHQQRFVNPTPFSLSIGIEYLFMAVLGGTGHVAGAVLGAAIILLLKERLQDVLPSLLGSGGNYEGIVFGLLMIVVLQRFSQGLWPALSALARRFVTPAVSAPGAARGAVVALPRRDRVPAGQLLLQASGIGKRFGGLVANEAVSLDLKAGEVHALIGPNGAGKSTFFDLISGVSMADAGEIRLMGVVVNGKPSRGYARLGLARTFQHVRLLERRSVLENVALGAHLRGRRGWLASMLRLERQEEAALLADAQRQVERCGLAADALAHAGDLPLGRQRIVEIARALAADPAVLLLDEPAAGLRHREKAELAALLSQLRAEGLGILVVEHDMQFVMQLADRVTVLEFGSVISHGAPAQVRADPRVLEAYLGQA